MSENDQPASSEGQVSSSENDADPISVEEESSDQDRPDSPLDSDDELEQTAFGEDWDRCRALEPELAADLDVAFSCPSPALHLLRGLASAGRVELLERNGRRFPATNVVLVKSSGAYLLVGETDRAECEDQPDSEACRDHMDFLLSFLRELASSERLQMMDVQLMLPCSVQKVEKRKSNGNYVFLAED